MLSIIVAMSSNRVIGMGDKLPWHLPSDLTHFKKLTWDHPVVMGRKTFESIPNKYRPLPGRINLVLSQNSEWQPILGQIGIVHLVRSWDEVLKLAEELQEVFVIGGESVYRLALPVAKRLYLTRVRVECEGDALFPEFEDDGWDLIERSAITQGGNDDYPMTFSVYKHRR
ncbi:MAG: dihydrofolate reductase [Candidatus Paceibacterota bacterium]